MNLTKNRRTSDPRFRPRRGYAPAAFTLVEVMLALSMFTASLIGLSQLLSAGRQHVQRSDGLTNAQLLCDSKMNELVAGVEPITSTPWTPITHAPEWSYAVQLTPTEWKYLVSLEVQVAATNAVSGVRNSTQGGSRDERKPFVLVRWVDANRLEELSQSNQMEPDQTAPH